MTKVLPLLVLGLLVASDARAEIVVFKNGRTMSAKSYKVDGGMATIALRDGGEVMFPASIVDRVDPDELPYPSPAPVETATHTPEVVKPQLSALEIGRAHV